MATKKDLINALNSQIDYLSKEDINDVITYTLDYLKQELANYNRIEIRGFGSFSTRDRKGVNNKTYKTIYYRMAKNIAEKINIIDEKL